MAESTLIRETVPVAEVSVWVLALGLPIGGILLARRNLRLGRSDTSGAIRVAVFVFITYTVARMFRASHASSFADELWIMIRVLALPALWATLVWLLYVALEPYARRRWPHSLISWKRLLGGRFRDPLVGRDVLLGAAAGAVSALIVVLSFQAPAWFGQPPVQPQPFLHGPTITSFHDVGFRLFVNQFSAVLYAMVFLFMLVLLRLLLRRDVLAAVVWCVLVGSPMIGDHLVSEWTGSLIRAVLLFFVLTRGGFLAFAVSLYFLFTLLETPLVIDPSSWLVPLALPFALVLNGLALYGFHTSLGGKAAFGRLLAED
jgi:serine/threonine-protein kinase